MNVVSVYYCLACSGKFSLTGENGTEGSFKRRFERSLFTGCTSYA